MTTPNFKKGTGRLAVDRFEYQTHINGTADRHTADQIDVKNPSLVYGNPANVEIALEDINTFIIQQINAGQGFVTVGDGYDTYHNQNGTINFDPAIPSLDLLLNPLFTAILNGASVPSNFTRIKHGGIILVKAGTYIIKQTLTVPPGIILLGEGYGTKIINATSLDFSGSPPPVPLKGSPTPAPVFSIIADGYRSFNDGAVDPNQFIFSRRTGLINMVIGDNFVEPTILGDTFYKLPQNSTSNVLLNPPPLVSQQIGSNLIVSGVMGMGRANFSSGKTVSRITGSFLGYDTTATNTETFTQLLDCVFDGFSIPVDVSSNAVGDGYTINYLNIDNCKMRAYGYFNGDSTDGYANTTIKSDVQNISITNSLFYGNATNVTSLLYLTVPPSASVLQDRSKVVITNNQIIVNKTSSDNTVNVSWMPIVYGSAITSPNTVSVTRIANNSFQTEHLVMTVTGAIGAFDIIAVQSSSGAIVVNLPAAILSEWRTITIKDISGQAAVNNITLHRAGSENIEGIAADFVMKANFQHLTLRAIGGNWYFIG